MQLLSGFVGTSGGFAGLVLPLSKCLVTGIPSLIGSSRGEGISFVDRESLLWAKLGHPCRVYYLSKAVSMVMRQMGIC